jgi:hypothetical protein
MGDLQARLGSSARAQALLTYMAPVVLAAEFSLDGGAW